MGCHKRRSLPGQQYPQISRESAFYSRCERARFTSARPGYRSDSPTRRLADSPIRRLDLSRSVTDLRVGASSTVLTAFPAEREHETDRCQPNSDVRPDRRHDRHEPHPVQLSVMRREPPSPLRAAVHLDTLELRARVSGCFRFRGRALGRYQGSSLRSRKKPPVMVPCCSVVSMAEILGSSFPPAKYPPFGKPSHHENRHLCSPCRSVLVLARSHRRRAWRQVEAGHSPQPPWRARCASRSCGASSA